MKQQRQQPMEPMTVVQYAEILEFIQKYCRFGRFMSDAEFREARRKYPKIYRHRTWKYVDAQYNTVDGRVWSISLLGGSVDVTFSTDHFNELRPMPSSWKYKTLYGWVSAYLKGEYDPTGRNLNAITTKHTMRDEILF